MSSRRIKCCGSSVMPFGLCKSPVTFKKLMETTLSGLTYESCLAYLDDVIAIGCTFKEHLLNQQKASHLYREDP
jgi:hypothetical protein